MLTVYDTSSPKNEPSAPVTRHSLRESRQRRHIPLAEDNLANQKLLIRLLENRGHTVVVAANGREALAALERERFDMLLVDVQMPRAAVFDRSAALSYVDGDLGLLQEMAETFLADYPLRLAEIREAVAIGDSQALRRVAHSLKGGWAASRPSRRTMRRYAWK
jgi:CheY-like chemotaxis protein